MHIALFTPAWPLESSHNGIVTFVHWMRGEFERLGHRVSVFTGRLDGDSADPRVHLVRSGPWNRLVDKVVRQIRRPDESLWTWGRVLAASILEVHRRDPIDVIEMEESFGWSVDVERLTRIPVLVKLHGPAFLSLVEEEQTSDLGRKRIVREGEALSKAIAIASPSTDTLQRTLARYRLAPRIAEHIVNPLAFDDAVPDWRLEASEAERLLFVGRFDRRKGADLVLRAFASLAEHRPALSLSFVGPDVGIVETDGARTHFEAYRDRVVPLGARSRIEYLGRMANDAIPALRCRARAVIVASRWENQGYTLLEAMRQGCPVVASDIGGNPELINDGRTGLLARCGDPESLARQLGRLLDDPQSAARYGAAARQHVIEHHATSRVAAQSIAVYERVIALARVHA